MLIFPTCSLSTLFTRVLTLRVQVQTLTNPSKDEFCRTLESYRPGIVYLQGVQLVNDEVGPLVWEGVDMSTPEAISEIFATTLPTAVCDISKLSMLSAFFMYIPLSLFFFSFLLGVRGEIATRGQCITLFPSPF